MKKHNRQGRKVETTYVCTHCKDGDCTECTDILRIVVGLSEICFCDAPDHSGEPALQQVRDPFTGDVHAPGMVIKEDGEIIKKHAFDPGYSGMSIICNQLVMRDDCADECKLPREDPIHE